MGDGPGERAWTAARQLADAVLAYDDRQREHMAMKDDPAFLPSDVKRSWHRAREAKIEMIRLAREALNGRE